MELADHYDDGGISGSTLERPALKRLIVDIEAGRVDVVVVYKIDRLSRSLMDFSKLVDVFERNQVKSFSRAFRWRKLLETAAYGTIEEMAAAEKITPSYASRVMRLTFLAPYLVEMILDGRQLQGFQLSFLMKGIPAIWADQE